MTRFVAPGSVYARYHAGQESAFRQLLYDDVGVADLARLEARIEDPFQAGIVAQVLLAKVERLQIKCGVE